MLFTIDKDWRSILSASLLPIATLAIVTPVQAGTQKYTVLSGHIYYLHGGEFRPYPWPKELTEKHLKGVLRDLRTDVARRDVAKAKVWFNEFDSLGSIAEYELPLAPDAILHKIVLTFEYGVYFGQAEEELWEHLGEIFLHVEVEKQHDSEAEAYEAVRATIEDAKAERLEVDAALATLFSINRKESKSYYFSDALLLLQKIAQNSFALSDKNFYTAMYIDLENGFNVLPTEDKIQIFNDLGYVFSQTGNINQYVGPDFTYLEMARNFYWRAATLALDYPNAVSAQLLARLFQGKYKIECDAGLVEECLQSIRSFFQLSRRFNRETYVAFYSDLATVVERRSNVGSDGSLDGFVDRVLNSAGLLEDWLELHCIATANQTAERYLNDGRYTREVVRRARLIAERAERICTRVEPNA